MNKKVYLFGLFACLCICVNLYPILYLTADEKISLLQTKSEALYDNLFWKIGFYTQIIFGGIALLTGWTQFREAWRVKFLKAHRFIGHLFWT